MDKETKRKIIEWSGDNFCHSCDGLGFLEVCTPQEVTSYEACENCNYINPPDDLTESEFFELEQMTHDKYSAMFGTSIQSILDVARDATCPYYLSKLKGVRRV